MQRVGGCKAANSGGASAGLWHSRYSMWLGAGLFLLYQNQCVCAGALVTLTGAIAHSTQRPKSGRAASIQIHGLHASQFDEVSRQLREGHADRKIALAPIDLH